MKASNEWRRFKAGSLVPGSLVRREPACAVTFGVDVVAIGSGDNVVVRPLRRIPDGGAMIRVDGSGSFAITGTVPFIAKPVSIIARTRQWFRWLVPVFVLLLSGCAILAPADSSVRIVNLTAAPILTASVTPCDVGRRIDLRVPIAPGASVDSPALEPGCYDVFVSLATSIAAKRVHLGEEHRIDVRIRDGEEGS